MAQLVSIEDLPRIFGIINTQNAEEVPFLQIYDSIINNGYDLPDQVVTQVLNGMGKNTEGATFDCQDFIHFFTSALPQYVKDY